MKYDTLFSQKQIGGVTIKNRVVMTAMGVDVSGYDGKANENTVAYYAERAKGGVGLTMQSSHPFKVITGRGGYGLLSFFHVLAMQISHIRVIAAVKGL